MDRPSSQNDGNMSSFPLPDPLRQVIRHDAPLISSALTQSPAQELDRSQSWPKWAGDGTDPRGAFGQDRRISAAKKFKLEDTDGSGTSRENSAIRINSGSFLKNSQLDLARKYEADVPGIVPEETKIPLFPSRPQPLPIARRRTSLEDASPELPRAPVQIKPYTLETPKDAPKYFKGAPADFSPWSSERKHAEDVLNEQSITSGHYDKIHITPNEMTSARPLIWSNVKHKSGLQILSSLFTCTLKQRQVCGTITSKCTFKPPPRVTLTDTKREVWLKDLADSTIPLRRLSRTIPHGIRGKALLEQCLVKNIPTWRAVWLVKCVGANEIRAFKRKGASGAFVAGGESKWIKDWTVQVQHFVESLIESCGTADWRSRITYGLQLVSHIYYEQLLERDAFLDWMCAALNASTVDALPIWLLLVRMYQDELVAHRRHGRQLATSLCVQYQFIHAQGPVDGLADLRQELSALIVDFMQLHPICFVQPENWGLFSDALRDCVGAHSILGEDAYKSVLERNLQVLEDPINGKPPAHATTIPQLITRLDNLPPNFDFKTLSSQCLAVSESPDAIVFTALNWATTIYRFGYSRLYLVVRLLRQWSRKGTDLNHSIFAFLEAASSDYRLSRLGVYKMMAELIRSRHFSISKYFQWLMARGTEAAAPNFSDFFSSLLDNVPTHGLPSHVFNLRSILFGSFHHSGSALAEAKSSVAQRLSFMTSTDQTLKVSSLPVNLTGLGLNEFYDLSHWMRRALLNFVSNSDDSDDDKMRDDTDESLLRSEDFKVFYEVLGTFNDHTILADVLCIFIEHGPKPILTEIVSTLNIEFDIFHAIGAAEDLFSRALQRFTDTLNRGISEKVLLTSLIDLADMLPGKSNIRSSLQKELNIVEHSSVTAAGSPVAEYVSDVSQSADSTFLSEMDYLFGSGSSMDRPLLSRIFLDITSKLESVWFGKEELLSSYFDLLPRLRFFDAEAFDKLMLAWLDRIIVAPRRPSLASIVPPLICNGSVSFAVFLGRASLHTRKPIPCPRTAYEVLGLFVYDVGQLGISHLQVRAHFSLQNRSLTINQGHYRYLCQRKSLIRRKPDLASSALSAVLRMNSSPQVPPSTIQDMISHPSFPELLQTLLISSPTDDNQLRETLVDSKKSHWPSQALDRTLYQSQWSGSQPLGEHTIVAIVQAANEFNTSLCHSKLASLLKAPQEDDGTIDKVETTAKALFQEAQDSDRASLAVWYQLVPGLPLKVLHKFQAAAISQLFDSVPTFASITGEQPLLEVDFDAVDRLLRVTGLVQHFVPPETRFHIIPHATEKIKGILVYLSHISKRPHQLAGDRQQAPSPFTDPAARLLSWILILLCLLALHRSLFTQPKLPQSTLIRLAINLSLLLIHPLLDLDPALSTRLFDLLACLSDALTPEARQQCFHNLFEQQRLRDPRLDFLFGSGGRNGGPSLLLVDTDKAPRDAKPGQDGGRMPTGAPYALRRWEMVSNATPVMGENDTSISLSLFGAKKAVL